MAAAPSSPLFRDVYPEIEFVEGKDVELEFTAAWMLYPSRQ